MKTKDIILRKSLTSSNLRIRLDVLFRTHEFKSNYINAHVQIILNNENVINLNEQMIFNATNKEEYKTFIQVNVNSFSNIFKKVKNVSARKIILYYIESDKEAYDKYLELNQQNLTKDINSPFNINRRFYSTNSLTNKFYSSLASLGTRFYSTNSKVQTKYSFTNVEYPIAENTILSDLTPYYERFITENKVNFENYISIICQIREVGNTYYTIGERFPIDINKPQDLTDYSNYIQNKWSILERNQYNPNLAMSILFNYTNTTVDNYSLLSNKFRIVQDISKLELTFKDDSTFNFPLNTFYSSWGDSMVMLESGIFNVKNLYIDLNTNLNRYIQVSTLSKTVTQINLFDSESNIKITTFVDKIISNNEFIRLIGNKTYYVKDNKLYFIFENLVCDQFISRVKPSKGNVIFNIMTLDVETYVDENNQMNIYCISLYDGVSAKTFYLTDYNNIHSLINEVLKTIFTKKYSGKSIYIHNSSEFDMIFLYSYLINFYDVKIKPIIKDGKFINLEVEYGDTTKYKVNFKDSLLLLTSSLAKLSKTFNVTYTKDMFPHNFVTKENLNYIGTVPEIKFFDNISEVEYNEYKSRFSDNNWSLKNEAIKYCELDCKALFEVIENFGFKIFKMFKINISTTPTLPSVSMKTYRTNFIPKGINIAKISGQMFDNIHKAFYGGHVDMYIPTNPIGTQVFGYDVNSLYPYVMKVNKYPYQYIGHFFGDISKMSQYFDLYLKCLGFYKVIITSPKDILNPIIPKKVDNTTVYGVGTWKGWYYSEELKNAARFGYTFDILEGYLFKAADLFSKYIETMNQMKENSVKNSPDYVIAKLLSNSLFGKFSLFRDLINYAVVEKNSVDKFISNIGFENLVNNVNIGNKCLVSYKLQFQDDLNINIAIGAAVTANARIFMTQFKNNPDYILYYSDTDSGFFNKPLPDYLVDSKRLGALKLEHVLNKFVALGPKVYGGIDLNGNEFTKTKGLKSKVSVSQLETLLQENVSLDIPQEKWFKNLVDSNIAVKDDLSYNLRANNNKRELLYKNGILVGTANKNVSD